MIRLGKDYYYVMDNLDLQILDLLTENSRISVTEISNQIGRSHSATRLRLAKIIESGVIEKFTVLVNTEILEGLSREEVSEEAFQESNDYSGNDSEIPSLISNLPIQNQDKEGEVNLVKDSRPVIGSTSRES